MYLQYLFPELFLQITKHLISKDIYNLYLTCKQTRDNISKHLLYKDKYIFYGKFNVSGIKHFLDRDLWKTKFKFIRIALLNRVAFGLNRNNYTFSFKLNNKNYFNKILKSVDVDWGKFYDYIILSDDDKDITIKITLNNKLHFKQQNKKCSLYIKNEYYGSSYNNNYCKYITIKNKDFTDVINNRRVISYKYINFFTNDKYNCLSINGTNDINRKKYLDNNRLRLIYFIFRSYKDNVNIFFPDDGIIFVLDSFNSITVHHKIDKLIN